MNVTPIHTQLADILYSSCSCHKTLHLFHLPAHGSCFSKLSEFRLFPNNTLYFHFSALPFYTVFFFFFFSTSLLDLSHAPNTASRFSIIFSAPQPPSLSSSADRGHFPLLALTDTCCTSHSSLPSANDQEVRQTRLPVSEAWEVPSVLCRLKILLVLLPAKLC